MKSKIKKNRVKGIIKVLSIILIGAYVLAFFYRPDLNIQAETNEHDFLRVERAPEDIALLFKNSCYDCHSDSTRYSWFDYIPPLSWGVDDNVKRGKFAMNFSHWDIQEDTISQEVFFNSIRFDVMTEKMPKKEYIRFHPDAKLSEAEQEKIILWIRDIKSRFLKEKGIH